MNIKKSALLLTSSGSDVQCSGGVLSIPGLFDIDKKAIVSIKQLKYRTERVQIVTAGASSYTPTGSTLYRVRLGDIQRKDQGWTEGLNQYSYKTPNDITTLGNTAALQREAIHQKLISQINSPRIQNYVTGASLGTGTGFTITDDAGYYPIRKQGMNNREGASMVLLAQNDDGTGFNPTDVTVTQSAIYSFGVGSRLLESAPVIDYMTGGNIIQGYANAPVTASGQKAVSGQNYDAFAIVAYKHIPGYGGSGESLSEELQTQVIFVDNGTGASTANLAGYIAFEKEMLRQMGSVYALDPSAITEYFDSPGIFQGPAGAVPAATGQNKIVTDYGKYVENMIGSATAITVTPVNTGYNLDHDQTDTEGGEITPSLLTASKKEFVVGKGTISVFGKLNVADHTDARVLIGLRIKAAHHADFNNYTNLAAIGFAGDAVPTYGIFNYPASCGTTTAAVPVDAAWEDYELRVNSDGTVTALYNNTEYPVYSVGTTPMKFDAGDIIIPTIINTNVGGGDPDVVIGTWLAVANYNWRQ